MTNPIPTGPAKNGEELHSLADLMRDPKWKFFEALVERWKTAALKETLKLDLGPEHSGAAKGRYRAFEEILDLPQGIGQQLKGDNQ